MAPETVMNLAYQGMRVALTLSTPLLLSALAIGLLVSLFQAVTQINEMTLSFIPKILGVFGVLVLSGPFLLQVIMDFTEMLLRDLPLLIR